MKIFYIFCIVLIFVNACSKSSTNNLTNTNSGSFGNDELCEKVSGEWGASRAPYGKGKEFCGEYPCGTSMGSLELSCKNNKIVGRSLIGLNTVVQLERAYWAEVSSEIKDKEIVISFNNKDCQISYRIFEFHDNQLFGELTSKNCKVAGENYNFNGDILLIRAR